MKMGSRHVMPCGMVLPATLLQISDRDQCLGDLGNCVGSLSNHNDVYSLRSRQVSEPISEGSKRLLKGLGGVYTVTRDGKVLEASWVR